MTKKEFNKLFKNKIVLLDGGMGTLLQMYGMPSGICPEKWATENPEIVKKAHKSYVEAGSDIIYTFTFGANPIKLSDFGLAEETYEINKNLASIAREAAENTLVAGDISSCGSLISPFGNIEFETAVESFKKQVEGLLAGGVDLFVIETMMDIQEARAALIAVKELCELPVMVTMTFEGHRTLMGSDPVTALITLQSLGADAVGCNCSSGPAEMVDIIAKMKPYSKVPLIAKPNAGKPRLESGNTVFDMDAEYFSSHCYALVEAGVNGIGGCCGTTPEYIKKINEIREALKPVSVERKPYSVVCSNRDFVEIHSSLPFTVIGERLNPTGKKALKEAILNDDMDHIAELAREQTESGAKLLDINAGVPGVNEKEVLPAMVQAVNNAVSAPVLLDTSDPKALEAALRIYPGRAIINSISGERKKLEELLPLAKKYGAMFVLLPVNDEGVPTTFSERISIIKDVYYEARKLGFKKEDILVDGLVMTVASDPLGAIETLKVISWCSKRYKINTTIGLSNVSFGLPAREHINSSFLSMAISKGLTTAIMNPNNGNIMQNVKASDVLVARDKNALNYIEHYSGKTKSENERLHKKENDLFDAIVEGKREIVDGLIRQELIAGSLPNNIIDMTLIPAIQKVGELYERKEYFLPQLIRGAEALERAMAILEPEIIKDKKSSQVDLGTIVIATVKGDVHDIGKNIVAMLLKNYGFNVIDLGKDVDPQCIIDAVKENNADIIALSALMTTTMSQMPRVMELVKQEGLTCKMLVGGAVLDKHYAESFGAFYASDAYSGVKLAQKLMNK
ncbi:MAG: dihydropteroate synthase [Clostridiaceae bacterium]|nr:dihydropteroate synthase [Clostridiaceae bacterium]